MSNSIPPCQEDIPDTRPDSDHPASATSHADQQSTDAVYASNGNRLTQGNSDQLPVTGDAVHVPVLGGVHVCRGTDGHAYIVIVGDGNAQALRIGGRAANNYLRRLAQLAGVHLKTSELRDINEVLAAHADLAGLVRGVWYRVAPYQDGIELDIGDVTHRRIRVTPGRVEIVENGSATLFFRTPAMQPLAMPADRGDLMRLGKYVNLNDSDRILLIAWLSYILAHPKMPTTSFPILVLQGDQGSGKSFLCRLIQALIDPSVLGVQSFPRNQRDLVIVVQNAHVLFFDNMRSIRAPMADTLCTISTGGTLSARQLFTDAEMHMHRLHCALVFNGIHSFIDQPDLAQRCLPLHLRPIEEKQRRSESELLEAFQADLPVMFRGILNLIADIFTHLATAEVTSPERMIDFVRWLAAMEKVDGLDKYDHRIYQDMYSSVLSETMLDSLQENPLAAAVLSFADEHVDDFWSGTPSELLLELNTSVSRRSQNSSDWPQNPISLSKRLRSLQAGLLRQCIDVQLGRGKERRITIVRMEGTSDE